MPCLLVILMLAFPRIAMVLLYLFSNFLERAYHSILYIVLGFIFLPLTTIVYGIKHGVAGFPVSHLKPTSTIFLALVPVLLFNYVGFELQSGASEEMRDPQKDVPRAELAEALRS